MEYVREYVLLAKAIGKTFGALDCIERGLNAGNMPCPSKSGPLGILEQLFQVKLLNRKCHKDFVANIGLEGWTGTCSFNIGHPQK